MKDSAFQDVFELAPEFSTFKKVWETKFKWVLVGDSWFLECTQKNIYTSTKMHKHKERYMQVHWCTNTQIHKDTYIDI